MCTSPGCLPSCELRDSIAVSKTDACDLVKGVSRQTAMKYVNKAIADGFLSEVDNPADGRSRLLRMSPLLRNSSPRSSIAPMRHFSPC